jgi:cardiolipin synthase (CMP-forming)
MRAHMSARAPAVPASTGTRRRATLDGYMPRWCNLANLFTLVRLILIPYVIGAILDGRHGRALELFFLAAVTDVIDGTLARSYGMATQVGAYLDPIADKCLLSGIFLAMGATGSVPWWFVAVVLGRDVYILVAVVAVLALTKVRKFPPSRWGKISTFVQIATAVTLLVENIWKLAVLQAISSAMLWVCLGFTIWSGVHYTFRGAQTLRAH